MSGLTLRDNLLVQAAADGLSGEEMEAKYGVPAAQAVVRVRQILRERDIWSETEQRKLLLVDLQNLKSQMQKNFEASRDSKDASALLRTLDQISRILENQSRITDEDLAKISSAQAKALLNLVVQAFGAAKDALEREYPDVDVEVIEQAFNVGLIEASAES